MTRFLGFMVFNATFNNISVILWWSVLLVEETGENHWPGCWERHQRDPIVFQYTAKMSNNMYRTKATLNIIALYREKQRCILNESLLRVKSRLSENEHFRSVAIFKVAFVLYMLLDILAVYWKTIGSLWCRSQQPGQWFDDCRRSYHYICAIHGSQSLGCISLM
jgi:hypothetical protein